MMSSRFDPGLTSVRPQKPWTFSFYGSMNGPGLKTLLRRANLFELLTLVEDSQLKLAITLINLEIQQKYININIYISTWRETPNSWIGKEMKIRLGITLNLAKWSPTSMLDQNYFGCSCWRVFCGLSSCL